ncbi:MAG: hypothetical protein U0R71_07545 [Solirubrobacterales bacterium]
MTNRRAKAVATATILGLGALGGVALGSNPGTAGLAHQGEAGATASVTTSASGATSAVPGGQTVAVKNAAGARAPVVTRASGATGAGVVRDD